MPTHKHSSPWIKVIIFIFIGVFVVAAIVTAVICCKRSQKKKELEKKKKSKSNSKSSKKLKPTVTRKPLAPPLPPPQPKIVPQVPIQSKSTTDETMTPPIQQIPTSHETGSVVTSPAPSEEVIRVEEAPREEVPREEVTVLCTYGNGWTKKSKPPRDFTFSIESE